MQTPLFVGVDIHHKDNHLHCLDPSGQSLAAFSARNNRPGAHQVIAQLTGLLHQGRFDGLRLAAEATNWYWLPFFQLLASAEMLNQWPLALYAFNPRVTAKYRDTFLALDKDAPQDARLLADRLRIGRELPPPFSFDADALALRMLTRFRHRLTHELTMTKLYCLNWGYLKASKYTLGGTAAFDTAFSPTSLKLLSEFAPLDERAAPSLDELAAWLEQHGRGRFADVERTAQKLHTIARDSYQLPSRLAERVDLALRLNLQHIAQLERLRKQLDRAIGEQLTQHPTTLTSIPGIGPVYAAGIIAEIGDIVTMHDASYAAYYEKKYNGVPKHKHKRAVTLTARKLVRLIVRLLTTNQPYQARRQTTTNGTDATSKPRRLTRRRRPR